MLPAIILLFIIVTSIVLGESQQYSLLAQAFLHGHLNFLHSIGGAGQDPVYYHGRVYWSEGVFPAILLMPFVAILNIFHVFFYQGYLQWLLILGVWWLVFRLARHFNYNLEDSAILAFGFTLGSVFIGVASAAASWYFAQVVATFLLFWGLYEFFVRRTINWWLIGISCGLVLITRATAAPIILFYILEILLSKNISGKTKNLIRLMLPIALSFILIGLYNYLRFNNPFHGGYADQALFPTSAASEAQGLFSLVHLPSNLFSLLLGSPTAILSSTHTWTLKFPYIKANLYGMSIFLTSPYLLYLFTRKWTQFDKHARYLLVAMLVSAILVLTYFGIGITQYGYRYSLDFLPELFTVFMIVYHRQHKNLTGGMKTVLIGSGLFNFYLLIPLIL